MNKDLLLPFKSLKEAMDATPRKYKPVPPNKWKKGVSPNPGGRPALSPELKQIKKLSVDEVNRHLAKFARMEVENIVKAAEDPKTTGIEAVIASAFSYAIKYGDPGRLQIFMDRAIPKPKDVPEININLSSLSDAELIQLAKDSIKSFETNEPLTIEGETI